MYIYIYIYIYIYNVINNSYLDSCRPNILMLTTFSLNGLSFVLFVLFQVEAYNAL